ncbi:Glutamate-1-semialdehyde 2,1-aminomutase 2 [bioreactor metagenome]|uniref:Glutamate-1-semialdehyde 2,1-aminomutase 2 n=1 Tax=bioreactor metagenome TaxID=1076179 RepID=A0A645E1E3_9ZZZZ
MEHVAPSGKIFAAGTYAGNPLSSAAGLALIKHMRSDNRYDHLNHISDLLRKFVEDIIEDMRLKACINGVGSMMCLYFGKHSVVSSKDAVTADREIFGKFFRKMLESGVYMAPSALENWFLSTAHKEEDMMTVEEALSRAMGGLR